MFNCAVLAEVATIYRQSKKKNDNLWTEWVSRPPAAVLVLLLRNTRVTPNQVSFAAIFIAALGGATLIAWRDYWGLLAGGVLLQLAYIVDCVDGQLARLTNQTSPVGALLDFMLDEVKAFIVLSSAAVRLWWMAPADGDRYLLIGLGGLCAAAIGITLTSFIRRPEYLEATGGAAILPATERGGHAPRSFHPVALVEAAGKLALHYPSWFLFVCLANRLDLYLFVYVGAHVLYLGRTALIILVKLGRPRKRVVSPATPTTETAS